MSQSEVVRKLYRQNDASNWRAVSPEPNSHSLTVKLHRFDVPRSRMVFEADDFPYMRAALLDKHLETIDA